MIPLIKEKDDLKKFHKSHLELVERISLEVQKMIKSKRKIMYADIINYTIRYGLSGEECIGFSKDDYNSLMVWCNYKIKLGEIFVEL